MLGEPTEIDGGLLTTANESRLADPDPETPTNLMALSPAHQRLPRSPAVPRVADTPRVQAHRSVYARVVKPLLDRLLALVLVVLLAPLLIVIAIGVRIT